MKPMPKILIDTREKCPLIFSPEVETAVQTLSFGDYSLEGFSDIIIIERKSVPDLVGCVGKNRDRFKKEMTTLRGFKYKCVIVEGTLQKLENGSWRGKILPASVLGSIASWRLRYNLEFIYAGSPSLAANETFRYLKAFHNLMQEFSRRFK